MSLTAGGFASKMELFTSQGKIAATLCHFGSDLSSPDRKHDYPALFFRLTCGCVREGGRVVAQLLPLLASTVDPDAEAHEDDPAGPADACDECRLLDHVGDLLSQTHVAFLVAAAASIAWHGRLFSWWLCGEMEKGQKKHRKRNDKNECVLHQDKCQHHQGLM